MIRKFIYHVQRLTRARRFGVPFVRRGSFRIPEYVRLNGQTVPVASPLEQGAKNDFLTCFIDDEYGLAKIKFPVRTIADLGANIGFFSMAARSYFPTSTIHAYEPNPRVLSYSSKNAAVAQFTLFAEAIGPSTGVVSIEDSGDLNQARTVAARNSSVKIPQVPLSVVVERLGGRVDLVKIDCEGAEWELFPDTAAWRSIRHMRLEYHLWNKHTFAEVDQALQRIGFEIHHHRSSGEWGTVWARNVKAE